MDLGLVRRVVARRPRAGRVFGRGHLPLFLGGVTRCAIQVDWALDGVDKRRQAVLGEGALDELGAGNGGALAKAQRDFLAVAVQDLV